MRVEPSLFDDLVMAEKIAVETSEFYGLILHLDDKSYYFLRGSGDLDGTSIDYGPEGDLAEQVKGEG